MKKIHTRKKSLMIRLCVLAFSAYVVVSLVSLQMEIADRRSTLASITEQAETQRLANKEIERPLATTRITSRGSRVKSWIWDVRTSVCSATRQAPDAAVPEKGRRV